MRRCDKEAGGCLPCCDTVDGARDHGKPSPWSSPRHVLCAAPLLLLWASARTIARWLSIQRNQRARRREIGDEQFPGRSVVDLALLS